MEKLYLKVVSINIMDIHIGSPIEFEKILDHTFTKSVSLTRQRMSIQQLLDQKEDQPLLTQHLEQYCRNIYDTIDQMSGSTTLLQQPRFTWVIDHETCHSSCWIFEALVPSVALAQVYTQEGRNHLLLNQFKDANKSFKKAETVFSKTTILTKQWKWKLPHVNHKITREAWHLSQKHIMQSFQHLCLQCVGISKASNSNTMSTIATRALTSASLSWMHWKTHEAENVIKLADGLRYLYSSNILWDNSHYGASIFRLQNWLTNIEIDTGSFQLLKEEFGKIPLLLQERINTNNGAYFDAVAAIDDLPSLEQVINKSLG